MRTQFCGVSKQVHSFFTPNNLSNACLRNQTKKKWLVKDRHNVNRNGNSRPLNGACNKIILLWALTFANLKGRAIIAKVYLEITIITQ